MWIVACSVASSNKYRDGKYFCRELARAAGCGVVAADATQLVDVSFYFRLCPSGCIDDYEGSVYYWDASGRKYRGAQDGCDLPGVTGQPWDRPPPLIGRGTCVALLPLTLRPPAESWPPAPRQRRPRPGPEQARPPHGLRRRGHPTAPRRRAHLSASLQVQRSGEAAPLPRPHAVPPPEPPPGRHRSASSRRWTSPPGPAIVGSSASGSGGGRRWTSGWASASNRSPRRPYGGPRGASSMGLGAREAVLTGNLRSPG